LFAKLKPRFPPTLRVVSKTGASAQWHSL
jgi:hypothetical protein